MYADRHASPEGIKPGSLAVAVAINVALVGALLLSNPQFVPRPPDDTLSTRNIPLTPPPEPQPTPEAKARAEQRIVTPPEQPDRSTAVDPTLFDYPPLPPLPPQPDPGPTATGGGPETLPLPPVLVGAASDPRFARDLQPDYPAAERRLEREGQVRLRVLVGVDGRVQQVERVDATSDAFFHATERQALTKWRFKPATRDGIPYESWKVMTVTFRLEQ